MTESRFNPAHRSKKEKDEKTKLKTKTDIAHEDDSAEKQLRIFRCTSRLIH